MTIQLSDGVRNAMLNAIETTVGISPTLRLYTGAQPANCAAAASGTLLATLTLPADWMAAASGGVVSKLGTWSGSGSAAGSAAHYRIYDSAGTTCHEQGSVTATAGGGDLTLDNVVIAVSQAITINTWSKTAGNA